MVRKTPIPTPEPSPAAAAKRRWPLPRRPHAPPAPSAPPFCSLSGSRCSYPSLGSFDPFPPGLPRASRLALSTARKPPGYPTNEEVLQEEKTDGRPRSLSNLPYRYGSRHGPVGFDGLPIAVDWRLSGVVSEARDQGPTDSCWAHAAAAAVESLNAIKTGALKTLSVQQLRECCNMSSSEGLDTEEREKEGGGNAASAFDYIIDNGGLVPEEVYSFKIEMDVLYKRIECDAVTLDRCEYFDDGTEEDLKKLVAKNPVCASVAVDDYFEYSKDKI